MGLISTCLLFFPKPHTIFSSKGSANSLTKIDQFQTVLEEQTSLPPHLAKRVFYVLLLSLLLAILTFGPCKSKKRYPDVPWLRMTPLPRKAGEETDAQAYVENEHKVI